MKPALILAQVLSAISICWAQSPKPQSRLEAEYYVTAYAQHYRVPVALVRAIVERESNWQAMRGLSQRRSRANAVDARDRQAAGSKRPLQSRPKRFRWRALPRVADATVS